MRTKPRIHPLLIISIISILSSNLFAQVKYEWKEMSALDVYDYKASTFWNYYGTDAAVKQKVHDNIVRARKLGFNMVRIPLNYIPNDFDPLAPAYDHGWPDESEFGTGNVFQEHLGYPEPQNYAQDILNLIGYVHDTNKMKVKLLLINHAGTNWALNVGSGYAAIDTPNNALNYNEMNAWLTDATAWIDVILSYVDISKIEVVELKNEAYASNFIASSSYSANFDDVFLLEMTNYFNHRWPSLDLLISARQEDNVEQFENYRDMLTKAELGTYTRPSAINYTTYSLNSVFFDYFSFHNYNTFSFRKAFQDVLNIGELQSHYYEWNVGEIGFDLGTEGSYEVDQAKFFQSDLQILDKFYDDLNLTQHKLKGVGIWSVFDYNYVIPAELGKHFGIMSNKLSTVKKRKAAYVVENNFEGFVDNPDFEIGLGTDTNFDDSPWCNGWTAYWSNISGPPFDNADYAYESLGGNHFVSIKGSINTMFKAIGWSSLPGGKIRVYPGTKITISSKIKLSADPGRPARVFIQLSWIDEAGLWISSTSTSNQVNKGLTNWQTITRTFTVPSGAYYTAPYLMAWYIREDRTVSFDDFTYDPEATPIISFDFTEDLEYLPPSDDVDGAIGWWTSLGSTTRNLGELSFDAWTIVKTQHNIDSTQVVLTRSYPDRDYGISGYMLPGSLDFHLKLGTIAALDSNDYPDTVGFGIMSKRTYNSENQYKVVQTNSPAWLSDNGDPWVVLQLEKAGGSDAKARDFTIFEKDPNFNKRVFGSSNGEIKPNTFELMQNYPNPFNPVTRIDFVLPERGRTRLIIYDILGREIARLIDGMIDAGIHNISWNASNVASSIYFYRLTSGNFVQTKKMVLLK